MKRWIPQVRALCERVRRPAVPILVGLALAAPGAGLLLRTGTGPAPGGAAPAARPVAVAAPESSSSAPEAGSRTAARPSAASERPAASADEGVGAAWRERALERKRAEVAERFARERRLAAQFAEEYDIPVSLAREIHRAAVDAKIPPRVAFGLVETESSFRRRAVSHAGAVGYTQLLPSTARWLRPGTSRAELFDTRTNLRLGFRYLRYLIRRYDGNLRLALTAYNRGPGTVDRLLRRGRNPDNGYAGKVLRNARG